MLYIETPLCIGIYVLSLRLANAISHQEDTSLSLQEKMNHQSMQLLHE